MSLRSALQKIVMQMRADILNEDGQFEHTETISVLTEYHNQLVLIIEASGNTGRPKTHTNSESALVISNKDIQDIQYKEEISKKGEQTRQAIEKRKQLEHLELVANAEDGQGAQMLELVGGPADATMIPGPPTFTVGMKTYAAGGVYILKEDRKAYYSQEETEKVYQTR